MAGPHRQYYPDVVQFEPGALSEAEQSELSNLGYALQELQRSIGNMHAVLQNSADGSLQAASDPRWLGRAEVKLLQRKQSNGAVQLKKMGATQ